MNRLYENSEVRQCFRKGLLGALLWSALLLNHCRASDGESNLFRVGISHDSFGSINRNDASAAIKSWAVAVLKERNLKLTAKTEVYERISALTEALANEQLDIAAVTSQEFMQIATKPETVLLNSRDQDFTEQFVLLVHRAGGIEGLEGLRGRKLTHHDSSKTKLVIPWLETLMESRRLGRVREFMSEISACEKPSVAILRVFFRQSDACLVTTNAYQLAGELNPQVFRDTRILASSPPIVPTVLFFRDGFDSDLRDQIEAAFLDLQATPSGRQLLTVFQGDRLVKRPLSCLEKTRQLLAEYDRICQAPPQDHKPANKER